MSTRPDEAEYGIWVTIRRPGEAPRAGWLRTRSRDLVRLDASAAWQRAREKSREAPDGVTYEAKCIPGWGRLAFRYVGLRMAEGGRDGE